MFTQEMQRALEADARKLSDLTGEDHQVFFIYDEAQMHPSTFEYLKPTDEQMAKMQIMREASNEFAAVILATVPGGADQTYILRKLRGLSMWCNVAITREADGSPRA